jgi:hypothetical protein
MVPNAGAASALVLLALASGFVFAYLWERTWYLSLRSEGQQLYLFAAVFAIPLITGSLVILWGASYLYPPLEEWASPKWSSVVGPIYHPALSTFAVTFLLAIVIPLLVNPFYDRNKLTGKIIAKYGSQSEKFFYETMTHKLPISVALDNRKVYVGYAWDVPPLDPRRVEDYAIKLLPVRSGYRDGETMELQFTTQYSLIYGQIRTGERRDLGLEDFLIVLPVKNIVSVNLFATRVNPTLFDIAPRREAATRAPQGVNNPSFFKTLLWLLTAWIVRPRTRDDS